MAFYCPPIWLDLVLVLSIDSSGLGGIGIHGYPASCLFVPHIHMSGYVGTGVSGYWGNLVSAFFGIPEYFGSFDLDLDWWRAYFSGGVPGSLFSYVDSSLM